MKLKLISNFQESYDMFFDKEGLEFRRISTEGPSRPQIFEILKGLGLPVPKHGYYKDFVGYEGLIVVHTDPNIHFGEGKVLKLFKDLDISECGCFLVQHIPYGLPYACITGHSIRHLFIGNRCFKMEYCSFQDWRSNCGDGDIFGLAEIPLPEWRHKVYYPLFAVDFVGIDEPKAIDFNIAPGVRGIGLEKLISYSQIVKEIKHWYSWTCCEQCDEIPYWQKIWQ